MAFSLPELGPLALAAALLGVASHLTYFIRGEHDFYARTYIMTWIILQTTGFAVLNILLDLTVLQSLSTLSVVSASFLASLFTSITIYRLAFHRLNKFPGPLSWKLTKWTHAIKNADALGYLHLDQLHQKYGPIVRTGPTELSIIDPAILTLCLGPGTKCKKAIWYDVGSPLVSMHQVRDKKLHDTRRRAWDRGFSAKALRDYESRVSLYGELLMKQLHAFGGKALNVSKWFNYYSFDVMG